MRTLVVFGVVALVVSLTPSPTLAQHVELGAGGGYVFGSGVENPGPSLPSLDGSVAVWPLSHWGVAYRRVSAPGEDLWDTPSQDGDRTYLGEGHLRYWAVTGRDRRLLGSSTGVQVGLGLQKGGQFSSVWILRGQRRVDPSIFFNGIAVEAFVTRRLRRHLTIHAGATFDFNIETNNLQPVVLAVVGF